VLKVLDVDVAGDVLAGEDGAVELSNLGVELPTRLDEAGQSLEDGKVRSDVVGDLPSGV
jgi:hypothetical protein